MSRRTRPEIKTPEQIAAMRVAGLVVARTLERLRAAVAPGVTGVDLDGLAEETIRSEGATPSFLGYHGFPASVCVSVNDRVVHGIPTREPFGEGDLVSLDCGAIVDGWHGDAAVTVGAGELPPERAALVRTCEDALWAGIAAAQLGGHVLDVSRAVEAAVRPHGYGVVEEYTGHGIGSAMHQAPDVPNYVGRGAPRGPRLTAGLALAVEPMITLGRRHTTVLDDRWTVVTVDGSVVAHAEHTFTLTSGGPWVLTALDGGAQRLAELGRSCGAPA